MTLAEFLDSDPTPGDLISVRISDKEGVIPEFRGKEIGCEFKEVKLDLDEPENTMLVGRWGDLTYGFHAWLIEEVESAGEQ
jgi:hypothetical protein